MRRESESEKWIEREQEQTYVKYFYLFSVKGVREFEVIGSWHLNHTFQLHLCVSTRGQSSI